MGATSGVTRRHSLTAISLILSVLQSPTSVLCSVLQVLDAGGFVTYKKFNIKDDSVTLKGPNKQLLS